MLSFTVSRNEYRWIEIVEFSNNNSVHKHKVPERFSHQAGTKHQSISKLQPVEFISTSFCFFSFLRRAKFLCFFAVASLLFAQLKFMLFVLESISIDVKHAVTSTSFSLADAACFMLTTKTCLEWILNKIGETIKSDYNFGSSQESLSCNLIFSLLKPLPAFYCDKYFKFSSSSATMIYDADTMNM